MYEDMINNLNGQNEVRRRMKKYYADRNSLNILRILSFILLIVIGIALKYILYILNKRYPEYFAIEGNTIAEIVIWSIMILVVVLYILYILILLPLWYNSARFFVTDKDVIARTGVLVKNVRYMKLSAIQYTTQISAPFSRHTGFNFIVFNGYGGRLMFMFLSQSDLEEITKLVRRNMKKNEPKIKKQPDGKGDAE